MRRFLANATWMLLLWAAPAISYASHSFFTGFYSGTISETYGTWSIWVNHNGTIGGSTVEDPGLFTVLRGSITSTGAFEFVTDGNSGAEPGSFAGVISADGTVSGTWSRVLVFGRGNTGTYPEVRISTGGSFKGNRTSPPSDFDGDGVTDFDDVFPHDASEFEDSDGDGVGNNADTDDDGDEMPDDFEIAHGFNPLDASDAGADADGDGFSNVDEFLEGRNPSVNESALIQVIDFLLLSDD